MKFKFDFNRAEKLQLLLSKRIVEENVLNYPPKIICGVDASYRRDIAVGASVNLSFPSMDVIEESAILCNVDFPYIPGFFAFRELKPILMSVRSLSRMPDVILVDGHGKAHPRGFGLACHLGLILNIPTIGVAKKLLCGTILINEPLRENVFPIFLDGRLVGVMIRVSGKPVYVSVGHKVCLSTAIDIVMKCSYSRGSRIPLPILMAHNLCRRKLAELLV